MWTGLREHREAAGLTQAELADRAGVSRQLVGAAEAGRNLPRVDAALALAAALGISVESLFGSGPDPVDVIGGTPPPHGSLVRIGRVGERIVTAPVGLGREGWEPPDAAVEDGTLRHLRRRGPGLVVAGCEPGLQALERLLRDDGMGAVAAVASSAAAVEALRGGRVHAAVVHGPRLADSGSPDSLDIDRFHLTRWQVGLAAPAEAEAGWWEAALSGRTAVIQREPGAGVQQAFERALAARAGSVIGPRVPTHLEATTRAVLTGTPAVTIEPAALAMGAAFHALETHEAQIWIARTWTHERPVTDAMNIITSPVFQRRLAAVGGYDLSGSGAHVG